LPRYPTITSRTLDARPFTVKELKDAGNDLPRGKAPGPDGVPDEVLREIVMIHPSLLLLTFNECQKSGYFFESWKSAKLVLLRKDVKPLDQPSSYRPLCLINSTEKLLKARIAEHLANQPDGLSEK
jgi:hypothetical protein